MMFFAIAAPLWGSVTPNCCPGNSTYSASTADVDERRQEVWEAVGYAASPLTHQPAPTSQKSLIRQRLEARVDLRHSPVLDLTDPWRVDCYVGRAAGGDGQIYRQIGHEHRLLVAAETGARRKQQTFRSAAVDQAVEIAELGEHFPVFVDHDDLVRLVRANPEVVLIVEDQPVGAVDAVGEDRRSAGSAAGHRDLHDGVIPGVGDEQGVLRLVEAEAVGAERRIAGRLEQRILHPWVGERRRARAGRAGLPDRALEGIGDIDVPGRDLERSEEHTS